MCDTVHTLRCDGCTLDQLVLKTVANEDQHLEGTNHMLREQKIKNLMARLSEKSASAPNHLWHTMASQIISVVGQGGFQSLYARSIFLTQRTYPWMAPLVADKPTDLSFAGLSACLAEHPPDQAREANTLLMLTFTDLLASLIGEQLTVRILTTAWGADADDLTDKETENE